MVGRICEKVGFKPGVKVRELWMRIEESGDSTEEDDVTGVGKLRGDGETGGEVDREIQGAGAVCDILVDEMLMMSITADIMQASAYLLHKSFPS